jgi:hypothetical protein
MAAWTNGRRRGEGAVVDELRAHAVLLKVVVGPEVYGWQLTTVRQMEEDSGSGPNRCRIDFSIFKWPLNFVIKFKCFLEFQKC